MFEVNDPEFHWFLQEVKKKLGIDLTGYKQHRVHRRVGILMKRHSVESYREYLKMITSDPALRDEFLDKMTINVTEFFRNPEKWQELRERFLPEIIKEKGTRNLKMWSAGCSTGEEPYTMAIILVEFRIPETVRVLATDIDPWVLEKARKGVYTKRSLVNLTPDMVSKYFIRHDEDQYEVKPFLKERVIFRRHDLVQDPYDRNLDLIVCRNVLIYFDEPTKKRIYEKFADSLRAGGIIFVGSTERILNANELGLRMVSPFIYRKTAEDR